MRIYLRLNMFMFVTDAERKKIRNHEEVHPGANNDETGVPVRWLPPDASRRKLGERGEIFPGADHDTRVFRWLDTRGPRL